MRLIVQLDIVLSLGCLDDEVKFIRQTFDSTNLQATSLSLLKMFSIKESKITVY